MINITFEVIITYIVTVSVIAVCIAIAADFILLDKRKDTKREKKSIVATGTMFMYYFFYYIIIRSKLGQISIGDRLLSRSIIISGTVFIALGAILNIWGRLQLKSNWANQIKIYKDHTLITTGSYSLVRHPLYASIMLMLFGGSLVYMNYISGVLTAMIFIPFMYHRARQEEVLLTQQFKNYSDYKRKTGMFFPKI
jgi:Putative protein-S-isoprenylcysteine methyltransferase